MFGREKRYSYVLFSSTALGAAVAKFQEILGRQKVSEIEYRCQFGDNENDRLSVESPDEYYRQRCFGAKDFNFYGAAKNGARFALLYGNAQLIIRLEQFNEVNKINEIISELDKRFDESKLSFESTLKKIEVFIGHGRNKLWRDLKDHLQDHHGIKVVAYETGSRAGHTIQEVLKELTAAASLAFLVHTAEDIDENGLAHARENVVHETGLFQGVLGFKRAIVLLEEGTNEFSNIAGLQQVRFKKGNIKETFGDVLAILRRELQAKSSKRP